jgi:hypothetical protein
MHFRGVFTLMYTFSSIRENLGVCRLLGLLIGMLVSMRYEVCIRITDPARKYFIHQILANILILILQQLPTPATLFSGTKAALLASSITNQSLILGNLFLDF